MEDMHEIRAAQIMPHKASDHCLKIWQRSAVPRYSAVITNKYLYRRGRLYMRILRMTIPPVTITRNSTAQSFGRQCVCLPIPGTPFT